MNHRVIPPRLLRLALDWVVPLAILAIGIVDVTSNPTSVDYPGAPWRHFVFLGVGVVLLGVRRRAPLLAPVLVLAVATGWVALWPNGAQGPFEGFLLLVAAAYCLGSVKDRRKLVLGGAAIAVWFLAGLIAGLVGGSAGDVAPLTVWLVVGFAIGYLISRRTEQARQALEANRILAAEQERQTLLAIEEERARIARELHDVVAHGLSVIVVQAGAERRSLDGTGTDLTSVDATLSSIERAGREALVDLRRLLGLLRRSDEPLALAPQPGLAQLDELVATAREAGLQVDVAITGEQTPLPAGLDLTAYRIVQEALTNVLKHGNARRVRVGVAFARHHLDLEVHDDGTSGGGGAIASTTPGHGLIGMRERATVFGGTVVAGVEPGGGWSVRVRLPVAAGAGAGLSAPMSGVR